MRFLQLALLSLFLSVFCSAQMQIVPTTTLSAETSNNTSASDGFKLLPDGDVGATNVSRESIKKLLPGLGTTKVYAHLMPWFGGTNHMNVGYDSADPEQCAKQVKDMAERGLDGAIIDWYGPSNHSDNATKCFFAAALNLPGFEVSVMVDKGAIGSTADPTSKLISVLQYAAKTYFNQPNYMKRNGIPVVGFFGVEKYTIDWTKVNAAFSPIPIFLYENSSGYTRPDSGGAFSWVHHNPTDANDPGTTGLTAFYTSSLKYPTKQTFGAVYVGFDDTLAAWSLNRHMNRNCGTTWLDTFGPISAFSVAGHTLDNLQIVTWNDYEEGTEVESGIENCVAVTASVNPTGSMGWSIGSGDAQTIDHYTVFASTDGQNLMKLVDLDRNTTALDLTKFSFAPGTYTLYVKAVGDPFMVNHMSNGATYKVAAPVIPASITVTSPAAGSTVFAPVNFSANLVTPNGCTGVAVYLDGVLVSSLHGPCTSTVTGSFTAAVGVHSLVAKFWDSSAHIIKTTLSFTVAPAPVITESVKITSPAANATVVNPVALDATISAPNGCTGIAVYVDTTEVYHSAASPTVQILLAVSSGTHKLTVKFWDSAGKITSAVETFTAK